MTFSDRAEIIRRVRELSVQAEKVNARDAYLYDHRDDPSWDDLHERAMRSSAKLGALIAALVSWADAPPLEFLEAATAAGCL